MVRRSAISKKDSPGYTQLCGYVPKDIAKQFKLLCTELDVNQSEGIEKAIASLLAEHGVSLNTQYPKTIAELVQQNYWKLREANIKNIEDIARGAVPQKADLVRIGSILELEFSVVEKLSASKTDTTITTGESELQSNGCS